MRLNSWLAVLCLLICGVAAQPIDAQSSVIHLPWTSWQVHPGDDLRCAEMQDPAASGSGCPTYAATDKIVSSSNAPEEWRRIDITLPADLQAPQQLALLLQGSPAPYEVFVNGQRIGGIGDLEPPPRAVEHACYPQLPLLACGTRPSPYRRPT